MHSTEIELSIAVATCNRPRPLERALISLRSQTTQPFEVVISDDSDERRAPFTREVANRYDCFYHTGPHRGLYANRNFAFKQCRGSHIRTMDDDHVLPPNHLSQCFDAVSRDPVAVWTTGEIGCSNGKVIGVAEVANQLGPSGVGCRIENPDDNWGIADGSTIYPRAVFDRGACMVEDFGFGSAYLEFGAYLYARGWKCRCVPGAMIEHHTDMTNRPDPTSVLFASICYNIHFRPDLVRFGRYLLPHLQRLRILPELLQKARRRWSQRSFESG